MQSKEIPAQKGLVKEEHSFIFSFHDLKMFRDLSDAVDSKFLVLREKQKLYQMLEDNFVPKFETERKQYTCIKCQPPRVYESKQEYAGHCKKHRYSNSKCPAVKKCRRRGNPIVKREESEELFRCIDGVINVL